MASSLQWTQRKLAQEDPFKTDQAVKTGYEGLDNLADSAGKDFISHMQSVTTNVVKSIDAKERQDSEVIKELSKILPKAGKAIQAGIKNKAEQIRGEEFLGANEENALDDEKKFGGQTNFDAVNTVISQTSQETSAILEQDGDVDGALTALKLSDEVEKTAALQLYLGPLRERVENALIDRKFNINGEWVSLRNATDEQKVAIKRKINAALYANLRETGRFSDKELYFGFVKPVKKSIEDEYVTDSVQTIK